MELLTAKPPIPLPQPWRPAGDITDAKAALVALLLPGGSDTWIACECYGTLHRHEVIVPNEEVHCTHYGIKLYRNQSKRLSMLLPLVVMGLIVYIVANIFPIIEMNGGGNRRITTPRGVIVTLYDYDMLLAAVLVAPTTVLSPLICMSVLAPLLIVRWRGWQHPAAALILRVVVLIRPWAMVEILMLDVVVVLIKMARMVSLEADVGLQAFTMLTIFLTVVLLIDPRPFWREIGLMPPPGS